VLRYALLVRGYDPELVKPAQFFVSWAYDRLTPILLNP
jgi:hypothetical protein